VDLNLCTKMLVPTKFLLPQEVLQSSVSHKSTQFTITMSDQGYKLVPFSDQNLNRQFMIKNASAVYYQKRSEFFVPRLFGKRTSSQLFQISKILRRRAQLDYKPKSLRLAQRKATFAKSKKTKSASSKKRVANNVPVYGTTGQHGYLTPSRLLNPYRIKRERYYTLGKGRKTPSELLLAYAREHKNRPSLFGALTASQLLTVAKRQANRSQNDRQLDASSSLPTISQLGLNRRASKSKAKPVPQPSSKLLKHLNQLPMEKSKNIDDALKGLTSSQLLVTDKKLQPQSKKSVQPQKTVNVYSSKKTSLAKELRIHLA
jgi:hypothetical protein